MNIKRIIERIKGTEPKYRREEKLSEIKNEI